MKKICLAMIACQALVGCSIVDDYMLGKDNTPKPTALNKIDEKITVRIVWSENVSPRASKPTELYKLLPVLRNNTVYTASASGYVQARSVENGGLRWAKDLNMGIASGPSVKDNTVVVGGAEASLAALSAKTGELLWRNQVSNQLLAPPIISGGLVIAKTVDGQVYAFNQKTGKQSWHYTHGAPNLILRASSAPVVVGGLVISGFADGKVDAISLENGRLIWQKNITYASGSSQVERLIDIDATPIVKGNTLYVVSYQGEVVALSLTNGNVKWRHKMSAYRDMALSGDALYIVDDHSVVWAINRYNGMVLWSQRDFKFRSVNAPAISMDFVYLTDKLGFLHILTKRTGEEIGRVALASNEIDSAPVLNKQNIFVLLENGNLSKYAITKL